MTVRVTDLRNHSGKLILSVYRSADGFIGNPGKAVATQSKSIDADVMTFTLDLPPGAYAVCVLHDENANQKMDTNLIGIPKEGYGVTNNPKPRFRVAKFGEARIALPAEGAAFDISLQYF
ncbi:MAG: DUF2141 domain-containing protein [Tepidisphaeraceae bacterium]